MLWCQALEQISKPSEETVVAKLSHMSNSSSQQASATTEKERRWRVTFCSERYLILEYIIVLVDCLNNLSLTKVLGNFEVGISRQQYMLMVTA